METQATNPNATDKLLYRPKTIAAMTDQSVSQVYRLIEEGTIRSVRCGRSIRVPVAALREFIEGLVAR